MQIYVVQMLRLKYPKLFFHAGAEGGNRNKITGSILKKMGVVAGIPDLHFPSLRLWIELKIPTGKLSESQKTIIPILEKCGDSVEIARSLDDVIKIIDSQINKLNI